MQIVVNGVQTSYEDINPNGKNTLVVLHGWGSSLTNWLPIAKLISKKIRIILVDLPGFGHTSPLPNDPEIPDYTNFIRNFTQAINLSNFILAGHSLGGQITFDYALKYPQDLLSFVLIAPALVREKLNLVKLKLRLADATKSILSKPPYIQFEKYVDSYTTKDYEDSNQYQKNVLRNVFKYNLKPFLSQTIVPSDIIWGASDILIPNTGDFLVKKIPLCRLHVVSHGNHLLHLTHRKELAKILNKILIEK